MSPSRSASPSTNQRQQPPRHHVSPSTKHRLHHTTTRRAPSPLNKASHSLSPLAQYSPNPSTTAAAKNTADAPPPASNGYNAAGHVAASGSPHDFPSMRCAEFYSGVFAVPPPPATDSAEITAQLFTRSTSSSTAPPSRAPFEQQLNSSGSTSRQSGSTSKQSGSTSVQSGSTSMENVTSLRGVGDEDASDAANSSRANSRNKQSKPPTSAPYLRISRPPHQKPAADDDDLFGSHHSSSSSISTRFNSLMCQDSLADRCTPTTLSKQSNQDKSSANNVRHNSARVDSAMVVVPPPSLSAATGRDNVASPCQEPLSPKDMPRRRDEQSSHHMSTFDNSLVIHAPPESADLLIPLPPSASPTSTSTVTSPDFPCSCPPSVVSSSTSSSPCPPPLTPPEIAETAPRTRPSSQKNRTGLCYDPKLQIRKLGLSKFRIMQLRAQLLLDSIDDDDATEIPNVFVRSDSAPAFQGNLKPCLKRCAVSDEIVHNEEHQLLDSDALTPGTPSSARAARVSSTAAHGVQHARRAGPCSVSVPPPFHRDKRGVVFNQDALVYRYDPLKTF